MTRRQNAHTVAKPEATRSSAKTLATRAGALASRTAALLLMRGPGASVSTRPVSAHGAITVNQSGQRDAADRSGKARSSRAARLNPWLGPWTAPGGRVLRIAERRHGTAIRLGTRHGHRTNATVYRETRVPHAGRVTLRFVYHALTEARHGLVPARRSWLELDLVAPHSGRVLARLSWKPARHAGPVRDSWRPMSVNLSRFHGQRLRLVFHDRQFSPGPTILVDLADVQVSK
jgi:hypothetical protein